MISTETDAAESVATVRQKKCWLRVPNGAAGMFLTTHKRADEVKGGQKLGEVVHPLSDKKSDIVSPDDRVFIGMVVRTVVYPGDALFHLGLGRTEH